MQSVASLPRGDNITLGWRTRRFSTPQLQNASAQVGKPCGRRCWRFAARGQAATFVRPESQPSPVPTLYSASRNLRHRVPQNEPSEANCLGSWLMLLMLARCPTRQVVARDGKPDQSVFALPQSFWRRRSQSHVAQKKMACGVPHELRGALVQG
jgi:hypothetical protein